MKVWTLICMLGIGAVPKRVMYYLLRAYSSGMDAEKGER